MTDKQQREAVQIEIKARRDAIRDEKKDHLARFHEQNLKYGPTMETYSEYLLNLGRRVS